MQEKQQNNSIFLIRTLFAVIVAAGFRPVYTQSPDEQYMAGCASFARHEYAKAVDGFSLAITRNNADEQLFIKRGASLLKLNEFERAIGDFEEANQIYPGAADLWLARTYALTGNNDKAVAFLKNHLNSEFRLAEDSIIKDPAFDILQGSAEWHSLWQEDWYSEPEKVAAEVNYYMKRKQYDEAISYLDGKLIQDQTSAVLLVLRGRAYYDQGNFAAAIADFSSSLNIDKNRMEIYSLRGMAYLKAGKYKDAAGDFSKALKDDPGNFNLYINRAEAYAGQQEWGSALKDILLYLKYFEDDFRILYRCGEYYYESGDYINALKCFNRNLKEDPNNSLYYKARGKTYVKTSTYRYAISDLSQSLDLKPGDAETWMYLGVAKIQSGDKENGCSDLEIAQKLGSVQAIKYILENCR